MKTTVRFVSNLKLDWNLFRLQLSGCAVVSSLNTLTLSELSWFGLLQGRSGKGSFAFPFEQCFADLDSSAFLPEVRKDLLNQQPVCRCWGGKLHPRSGGWINSGGAARAAGGRDAR